MDDKHFDPESAEEWITTIEHPSAKIREIDIYPLIEKWVGENHSKNLLDIGCGQGDCSRIFDKLNLNYTGVEPSDHLLNRAKQMYSSKNKTFVAGSIYSLPFKQQAFDSSFSVSVWHLLSNLEQASMELSRVLKPNGHFLIITANPDAYDLWTANYSECKVIDKRFEGKTMIGSIDTLYFYTKNEICGALESAGLEITQTTLFRNTSSSRQMYITIEGRKR